MRKNYDKLIRDRVPEIMDAQSVTYEVRVMTDAEYQAALREKIVEEASEVAEASPAELTKELADLQEVMDALMVAVGITSEEVRAMQVERRDERGGFSERLKLLWTE